MTEIFPGEGVVEWNAEKNAVLTDRYGFGFDRVVDALRDGALVDDRAHPNEERYPHQRQFVVRINHYICIVPYVETEGRTFPKTMFPSRKATRQFLGEAR